MEVYRYGKVYSKKEVSERFCKVKEGYSGKQIGELLEELS